LVDIKKKKDSEIHCLEVHDTTTKVMDNSQKLIDDVLKTSEPRKTEKQENPEGKRIPAQVHPQLQNKSVVQTTSHRNSNSITAKKTT